jgi:hypothetical protein
MTEQFEEAAADALTTVRLIPRWKLTPPAWTAVADALNEMDAALASGEVRQVRRASETLDALGPVTRLSAIPRSARAGQPHEPPPPGVLELVNTLIHPTGGWAQADPASSPTQPR